MTSPALETQGLTTRTLAADLLRTCLDRKLTIEEAMSSSHDVQRLDARDRAFLSTLLLTSFRHGGEIDAILARLVDRPLPRKSGSARSILILGVTQLLFLDMAPHAVIDLAVRSAKADRNALHFSGLINAVFGTHGDTDAPAFEFLEKCRHEHPFGAAQGVEWRPGAARWPRCASPQHA